MFHSILIHAVITECKIGNLGHGKHLDFYIKIKIAKAYANVIKREISTAIKMCYNGKNAIFYNIVLAGPS